MMIAIKVIVVFNIFRFKQCTFTASFVGRRQYYINSYVLNVFINLTCIYRSQRMYKLLGNNSQFGVQ